MGKSVIFVADSLDNAHKFQQVLSGLDVEADWYTLPDGASYSTGEHTSDRHGRVTWRLTVSDAQPLTGLTPTFSDSWDFDAGRRTLTLPTVKAGDAKNMGRTTLRVQTAPARASTAVKVSSRSAVRAAYKSFRKNVRVEKPVKVKGCKVSATPLALQKRVLNGVNFTRSMVGTSKVRLDASLSAKASKSALIQYRQGYLDHYPRKTSRNCWTKAGAAASGRSNLSYGAMGAANVLQYVDDDGTYNVEVGHRRWIMDPQQLKIGTGYAQNFNALYVVSPGRASNPTPLWIRWPSAGYFPSEVEPGGRWSFMTTRSDMNFSRAKVSVTVGSKKLRTSVIHRDQAPQVGWQRIVGNQWGVVWTVKNLPKVKGSKVVTAKVRVSGLTLRDGTKIPTQTYRVKLFRAGA